MDSSFKYIVSKEAILSARDMYQKGGHFQKAATTFRSILGAMASNEPDPFLGIRVTKHGENRIAHCTKYDLDGASRLVTVKNNGSCILCYFGDHQSTEAWIERSRGYTIGIDAKKNLVLIKASEDIREKESRIHSSSDLSVGRLVDKLPIRYFDKICKGMAPSLWQKIQQLESTSEEDEILELCYQLEDKQVQDALFDVMSLLRGGDVDGAKARADLFTRTIVNLADVSPEEIKQTLNGDQFIDSDTASRLLKHYMQTADYRDWMLFMGAEQREVAHKDFQGPARLSGVSGSGKTCIVINRAVWLAEKYKGERILILTLNNSLASLIRYLVDHACPQEQRNNIQVLSFWGLCQEKLKPIEPTNFHKCYQEETWKNDEHVSTIWDEYYDIVEQRDCQNFDASVLFPIHQELITRGVYPKGYINEEFDWIRSAVPSNARDGYYSIQRRGRKIPFDNEDRKLVLAGLDGWERKMQFVGVVDYLGLAIALHRHLDELTPEYRCILVDETQDFGTIELEIVRKLVKEQENDIFLSGDIIQRVTTKYYDLETAGIDIRGRSTVIRKNYRNSREILQAAHDVILKNLNQSELDDTDFELLEPEYANYSTPKPLLLSAKDSESEFRFAYQYAQNKLGDTEKNKICIVLAGLTHRQVKELGKVIDIEVLNGATNISDKRLFLSDMAEVKGYEFDSVIILNCSAAIIPNPMLPHDEEFRELSKLYVSMTRAKQELIVSYSGGLSPFISKSKSLFVVDEWKTYSSEWSGAILQVTSSQAPSNPDKLLQMDGTEFLYTKEAVGMPRNVQDKLVSVITGKRVTYDGKQTEWPTIAEVMQDRKGRLPALARMFGDQTWGNFMKWMSDKKLIR